MTYQRKHWDNVRERLARARKLLDEFRSSKDRGLLDDAIWNLWSAGEYSVNVCLEMHGLPVAQDHSQPAKAGELYANGHLTQDYSKILAQLERFRRQASHLGYNRDRSTHYNATNVENGLVLVEQLVQEAEDLLHRQGKL